MADDSTQTRFSLGRSLGLNVYAARRFLILLACILAVFQYGLVLTNGVSVEDFNTFYSLTSAQGDTLYAYMNFGACALSFIPGLCYDRLGSALSIVIGLLVFNTGLILQLMWGATFPAWLGTMPGLEFCYLCFGCAASFFNVIGSLAPLVAYPEKDIGKVSACIQVCMSLGMTLQSQVYSGVQAAADGAADKSVMWYLWFTFIFTNVVGIFMMVVFSVCRKAFTPPTTALIVEDAALPTASLRSLLLSSEFSYFTLLFFVAIGFSFSFLNVESRIAAEVGVSGGSLASWFGVLNALGRLSVNIPLDCTRHHPLGGVFSYLTAALFVFSSGIMLLAFPAKPTSEHVYVANGLVAYGYGGLLGMIPPALRLFFGTTHLGVIYGILYLGVAISEPLWDMLFFKKDGCVGVQCYRVYNLACLSAFAVTIVFTVGMLFKGARCLSNPSCEDQGLDRHLETGDN